MKRRLLSIFCALCLCLTLLPTAALADGLETGTPTLLNGEGEKIGRASCRERV